MHFNVFFFSFCRVRTLPELGDLICAHHILIVVQLHAAGGKYLRGGFLLSRDDARSFLDVPIFETSPQKPRPTTFCVCHRSAEPLVSVSVWDDLKSAIEAGESGTYELASDLTCDETITIAEGQNVFLTSSADAPSGKYSISPASTFTGGTSPTTSTMPDGSAGGDYSMFVVENGGSLSANNVIFDSSLSDGGTEGSTTTSASTTETTASGSPLTSTTDTSTVSANGTAIDGSPSMSTTDTAVNGSSSTSSTVTTTNDSPTSSASIADKGGVRAIYTAGDVAVENCDFVGSGDGATESVMNGGAVRHFNLKAMR